MPEIKFGTWRIPAKTKLRIGLVGCGSISVAYLRNAPLFRDVEITACADIRPEAAARRAAEYGLRAMPVEALIADPEIDLVLNLTIPAAHFDISMQALAAGKHVFTEKPLAVKAEAGRAAGDRGRSRGALRWDRRPTRSSARPDGRRGG